MNVAIAGMASMLAAIGAAAMVYAISDADRPARRRAPLRLPSRFGLRLMLATMSLVLVMFATGWPAAALWLAVLAFASPSLVGINRRRAREVERIEAIATWAEMLRDQAAAGA